MSDSTSEREQLRLAWALMRDLLARVGKPATCKGCGAAVFWVNHPKTGKKALYDPSGIIHFATCPKAADFRGKGKKGDT